ncbi:MAG TPA: hypothetical protein VKQ52_18205, partial [Puia sp.]|nr:hypothetical protein [Puia sp.]
MRSIKRWWMSMVYAGAQDLPSHDPQRRVIVGINLMSLSIGILNLSIGTFVGIIIGKTDILAGVAVETL